jgi:hypothetical protein
MGLLASTGFVFGQSAPATPPGGAEAPTPASAVASSTEDIDQPLPLTPVTLDDGKDQAPAGTGGDTAKGSSGPAGTGTAAKDATGAKLGGIQPLPESGPDQPVVPPGWAFGVPGEDYHFAAYFDYLIFFTKNAHALPALVIGGGSITDAAGNIEVITTGSGDLDLAGGTGASLQYGLSSGARLTTVYWWDRCPDYGLEANGMFLGKQSLDLRVDNCPTVSRPFCNASDGSTGSFLVAFPGVAVGGVTVSSDTHLLGGELSFLYNLVDDPIVDGFRMTAITGLRYLELDEGLLINSVTSYNSLQTMPQFSSYAGSQIRVSDNFLTRNQFVGIQSGLDLLLVLDIGKLNFRTDVAVGTNHEELTIRGSQLRINPDGSSVGSIGGLLALPSNIGRHTREQFVVLPEFNLNWLVSLSDSIQLNLGYTFIYLDRVIRPGDQIDRTIDISQVPNFSNLGRPNSLSRPAVNFAQGDYYAHGFNIGIEFRW